MSDPELAAHVGLAQARLLQALGDHEAARAALEQALAKARGAHPGGHPLAAEILGVLADVLAELGDGAAAIGRADEGHKMLQRLVGPEDLRLAAAEASRARARLAAGHLEQAEAMARAAAAVVTGNPIS